MKMAIELAKKGLYSTKPNPLVGCVLVKNDQVIGQGWHHKAGLPHAEPLAMTDAENRGHDIVGSTAYVTLEPCSHYGRTPPCADRLVNAKISRCVIAMLDPNPLVAGNGVQLMRNAGIEVEIGVLEDQAEALNPSFLFAMRHQKPYVRLKMAASLDGRTAMPNGESQWITGPEARKEVHKLRLQSQAILTGIGTVLSDDPSLTVRLSESELESAHLGLPEDKNHCYPLRVVLDTDLKIPPEKKILQMPGKTLLVCSSQTLVEQSQKVEMLSSDSVEVIGLPAGKDGIDLECLMQTLFSDFGIQSIMVEAGATLTGRLIAQDLVNELHIYLAPCLLGSEARAMFDLPELQTMADKIEWVPMACEMFGEDIRWVLTPKKRNEQHNVQYNEQLKK